MEQLFSAENGDFDIQKKHLNGHGEYVVSSGENKNGIVGRTDVQARIFSSNTITVDMFGNSFYHPYKYKIVTHARVFSLKPKHPIDENIGMYIISSLKYLKHFYSYGNMCSWEKIKKRPIVLPVNRNNKIDYKFMEEYVSELKKSRINEIKNYINKSGLENCSLTKEESHALHTIRKKEKTYKMYRIDELFDIATGRDIIISKTDEGCIPLISHQHDDNGISKRIKEIESRRLFNHNTTLSLADRGVFLATTQAEDFHIGTRVKALTFKSGCQSENVRLFFVACINKLQVLFLDYLTNATDKLPILQISVPLNEKKQIDYIFMDNYIKA